MLRKATKVYVYVQCFSLMQNRRAHLYVTEYETGGAQPQDNGPFSSVAEHNVPCAVCYTSTRGTVVMIPAQYACPSFWTPRVLWISYGKLSW